MRPSPTLYTVHRCPQFPPPHGSVTHGRGTPQRPWRVHYRARPSSRLIFILSSSAPHFRRAADIRVAPLSSLPRHITRAWVRGVSHSMKRARSPSADSTVSASAPSAASLSSTAVFDRSPSSSSSLSAVVENEDPTARPLLSILEPVLAQLKEGELFADALRRFSKEKAAAFEALAQLHQEAMTQHEFVMMRMTREAILLRALEEARRTSTTLPHVWMMRWKAKPTVQHGPFADDAIQQWGRDGYFGKKEAELRDINGVGKSWRPALSVVHDP